MGIILFFFFESFIFSSGLFAGRYLAGLRVRIARAYKMYKIQNFFILYFYIIEQVFCTSKVQVVNFHNSMCELIKRTLQRHRLAIMTPTELMATIMI